MTRVTTQTGQYAFLLGGASQTCRCGSADQGAARAGPPCKDHSLRFGVWAGVGKECAAHVPTCLDNYVRPYRDQDLHACKIIGCGINSMDGLRYRETPRPAPKQGSMHSPLEGEPHDLLRLMQPAPTASGARLEDARCSVHRATGGFPAGGLRQRRYGFVDNALRANRDACPQVPRRSNRHE